MSQNFYTTYDGRTSRKVFWYFGALPFFGIVWIGGFIAGLITGSEEAFIGVLTVLVFLLIYPWAMVCIKRFHDIGLPGWCFGFLLVPYVSFLAFLVLGFYPGGKGENKYGPDPKRQREHEVAQGLSPNK